MEKAKEFLQATKEESDRVSRLTVPPHRVGVDPSFYDRFALRGIRFHRVDPGFISCTFRVPPRLTDRNGKLAAGAIANIVDLVGSAAVPPVAGRFLKVSVDMSISYLSTANLHDELEITARLLGQRGGYSATNVLVRNKTSGELLVEGRHSFFGKHISKI